MEKRRQPEIIAGRVNSDGTIAAGDGFTSSRTSAGLYVVTLPAGFRLVTATASPATTSSFTAVISFGSGLFQVSTFATNTAVISDCPFAFTAVGVQT